MSGIFGFCVKEKDNHNTDLIASMLLWNRVFGDLKEDIYSDDCISMGCCVEKISDKYIQDNPIVEYKGRYAVIDALIFNREDLTCECSAESNVSDAELLLRFVSEKGLAALSGVNGDFAGAIYDKTKREVILFRDHMGVRPLYLYKDEDTVAFSTDLKGLLSLPFIDASISESWIYKTVCGYNNDDLTKTPYEKICCVEPASYVSFSFANGKITACSKKYWKLGRKKIKKGSEEEYTKGLRSIIEDAVQRRLDVAPGTVGAELSGGLDSGVIDILINRAGREGVYYSWSPSPDDVKYTEDDERLIIDDICKSENITCNYSKGENSSQKVECRLNSLGIETAANGSIDYKLGFLPNSNTYGIMDGALYAREKGARVMFTGHGGDEGVSHRLKVYEMFYNHEYYHYWKYLWSITNKPHRIKRTFKKGWENIKAFVKAEKESFVSPISAPELLRAEFSENYSEYKEPSLAFGYDPIKYINSGGSRNRLDNLAFFGAYSGIRYLIPYLDYRVIDYAVSIPRYLYINRGVKRYIFRQAFKDIIPDSLYNLQTKEDTSYKNIESNNDWYDYFAVRKAEIINCLDRNLWSKYLDLEKIEELLKQGKPTEEEYEIATRQLGVLRVCALAQNIVDKARR